MASAERVFFHRYDRGVLKGTGMQKVIIYGVSQQAQQIKTYIEKEDCAEVSAFVVDAEYKNCEEVLGLPVYAFGDAVKQFPPAQYEMVLSFGYRNMVKNREDKFEACKRCGYTLYTFISQKADVYTEDIGEGSIIYPHVFLAPFTRVGKGAFLENGVSIAHHTRVGDFVFCAPRAVVCGDVSIGDHCFLGSNCTVINSIKLSERTLVAAGARVSRNTKAGTICWAARGDVTTETLPEMYI